MRRVAQIVLTTVLTLTTSFLSINTDSALAQPGNCLLNTLLTEGTSCQIIDTDANFIGFCAENPTPMNPTNLTFAGSSSCSKTFTLNEAKRNIIFFCNPQGQPVTISNSVNSTNTPILFDIFRAPNPVPE